MVESNKPPLYIVVSLCAMRLAPIALGVSCTLIALVLSRREEEPLPLIVREGHQPVPAALPGSAPLPLARTATRPELPATTPAEAPLPADCVPGRLCDTPQLQLQSSRPRKKQAIRHRRHAKGMRPAHRPFSHQCVETETAPARGRAGRGRQRPRRKSPRSCHAHHRCRPGR